MLLNDGKTFWLFLTCLIFIANNGCVYGAEHMSQSKVNLGKRVFELIERIEQSNALNDSTKFSALLCEFLIKQKVRFVEPTRYEKQVYYHLLHKLDAIIRKTDIACFSGLHSEILGNLLQKNVLLMPPHLKYGHIDANIEYESVANKYEKLVGTGFPNSTISDFCLADLSAMSSDDCNLSDMCLDVIISYAPTYGYQRTHQILLLFLLMHHKCAAMLNAPMYELLASAHCTQAYREQNVIRSWGMPYKYRDLYLEQIVICGLFGFNEFMNWRNVVELSSWPKTAGCFCMQAADKDNSDCECNNHLNSLALVYYVNSLLLLN